MVSQVLGGKAVQEWVSEAASRLEQVGIFPGKMEAEWMAANILRMERWRLSVEPVSFSADQTARAEVLMVRRLRREPLAYVLGEWSFMDWVMEVNASVLVPRPETEGLVEEWLKRFHGRSRPEGFLLDMGTGSGCVAVALASRCPDRHVDAVDVSEEALAVAGRNFTRHHCAGRVGRWRGSLWEAMPIDRRYAGMIANLPYIPTETISGLDPEVLAEPREALDGGLDGLGWIRKLLAGISDRLWPGALVGLEVGGDQAETVVAMARAAGAKGVESTKDLQGRHRYVFAEFQ